MIRFFCHIDPYKIEEFEDWAKHYNEALFLIETFHKLIWGEDK